MSTFWIGHVTREVACIFGRATRCIEKFDRFFCARTSLSQVDFTKKRPVQSRPILRIVLEVLKGEAGTISLPVIGPSSLTLNYPFSIPNREKEDICQSTV